MANYNAIRGRLVQNLSSDPSITSAYEGQVWYNSTESVLKGLSHIKAFASGGNVATGRNSLGGTGTQTATIVFGGNTSPPTYSNATEEYGGGSWVVGGNLGTARANMASAGTLTAGLSSGGQTNPTTFTANVEEYDGSSWSEVNNLSTPGARRGCGTQTAGLVFGGTQAPPVLSATEEYDGTNWTNGGSMNTARNQLTGCGIQTSALAISGGGPGNGLVEQYDGSTWTNVSSINTNRYDMGSFASNADHAIGFGGYVGPSSAATEEWDGSSWVTTPATLGTARYTMAGSGTATSGLSTSGRAGPRPTATEEYNSNINVVPAAVWTSGGNIGTTRRNMAAAGITSAGLIIGGFGPPYKAEVEEYNGTSWSEQNNTPVAKENGRAGAGIQTAAFNAGGSGTDNGPAYSNSTQEYDGTNWTAGGNMNQQGISRTSCGTLTAGLGFGGYVGGGFTTATEEYDGSSWSTQNALPTASYYASSGTQTAALGVRNSPSPLTLNYDGTSWTSGTGNLNFLTDIGSAAKNGTQTKTVIFGGNAGPTRTGTTEEYDGTAFTNTASLSTFRGGIGGSGDIDEAYAAGGYDGSTNLNSTEEYSYQGASVTTSSTLSTS